MERGVGSQLREARIRQNLSVQQVATQLRLSKRVVEALEEDDFEHLPPATYVRGYLFNYARLLNQPEGDILAAFNVRAGDAETRPSASLVGSEIQAKTRRVSPAVWAIPLIALGGLVWWVNRSQSLGPVVAEVAPEPAEDAGLPPPEEEGPVTAESQTSAPAAPLPLVTTERPRQGPVSSAPGPAPSGTAGSSLEAGVGVNVAGQQADSLQTLGGDTVVLRFVGESWASVTDADGKRLLHETGAKGATKTLQGRPPFKLMLGRPADVEIQYQGQPYVHGFDNRQPRRFEVGVR